MKDAEEYVMSVSEEERIAVAVCSDGTLCRSWSTSSLSIVIVNRKSQGRKYEPVKVRRIVSLLCEVDSVTESRTGIKKGEVYSRRIPLSVQFERSEIQSEVEVLVCSSSVLDVVNDSLSIDSIRNDSISTFPPLQIMFRQNEGKSEKCGVLLVNKH